MDLTLGQMSQDAEKFCEVYSEDASEERQDSSFHAWLIGTRQKNLVVSP